MVASGFCRVITMRKDKKCVVLSKHALCIHDGGIPWLRLYRKHEWWHSQTVNPMRAKFSEICNHNCQVFKILHYDNDDAKTTWNMFTWVLIGLYILLQWCNITQCHSQDHNSCLFHSSIVDIIWNAKFHLGSGWFRKQTSVDCFKPNLWYSFPVWMHLKLISWNSFN